MAGAQRRAAGRGGGVSGGVHVAQYQYGRSSRYDAALRGNVTATAQTAGAAQPADGGSPVDFATLQAVNPDAAAWLEMPGLDLSLPIVQAQDNQTYLHRGFDGSDSPAGCLFFAASTDGDAALYRVIYGHNLHDGSMSSGATPTRTFAARTRPLRCTRPRKRRPGVSSRPTPPPTRPTCTAPTARRATTTTPLCRACRRSPPATPAQPCPAARRC